MPIPVARSFIVSDDPRYVNDGYVGGPSHIFSTVKDPNNPDASQRNLSAESDDIDMLEEMSLRTDQEARDRAILSDIPFDRELGYIVNSEDDGILAANGLNPKQREVVMGRGKTISDNDVKKAISADLSRKQQEQFEKDIKNLGPAEIDSYIRFRDLAL